MTWTLRVVQSGSAYEQIGNYRSFKTALENLAAKCEEFDHLHVVRGDGKIVAVWNEDGVLWR